MSLKNNRFFKFRVPYASRFEIALCISLAISCSAQGPLLGDVNGDGMLNSDDAVFLLSR